MEMSNITRRELLVVIEFLQNNLDSLIIIEYICSKYGIKLKSDVTLGQAGQMVVDYLMQYTGRIDSDELMSSNGMTTTTMTTNGEVISAMVTTIKIETQPDFDVSKYVGLWYNAARIPQPFDRNTPWETANYRLVAKTVIEVLNTAYTKSGAVKGQIIGKAVMVSPKNPALLYVSFPTGQPAMQDRRPNYIVHNTDYKNYAIVGSYDGSNLYLLVRQRPIGREFYNSLVSYAKGLGYDTSKLVECYEAVEA